MLIVGVCFNPRSARRRSATSSRVCIDYALNVFQSSLRPKAERNGFGSLNQCWFGFNPRSARRRSATWLHAAQAVVSSFNPRSARRRSATCNRPPAIATSMTFQSSLRPKAERNAYQLEFQVSSDTCFNPRSARRRSATDAAERCRTICIVSILAPPEGGAQPQWCPRCEAEQCFNPRSARRRSATRLNPELHHHDGFNPRSARRRSATFYRA